MINKSTSTSWFGRLLPVLLLCSGVFSFANASDYTPLVSRGSSGFNTIFSPTPIANQPNSLAIESNEAILFSFIGTNSGLKWRAFLPPGTKYFQATMYTFASAPATKVVARFEAIPSGGVFDVTPENAAQIDNSTVLRRLLNGSEIPLYSPESSGSIKLSSRGASPDSSVSGGWVYFNTLEVPGGQIFKIETTVTVDEACYRSWFANAQFDALGNPTEGASHTCSGSTGGTIIPLTGIALSADTLIKGSTGTISISPVPSNASLPGCSAQSASGIANLVAISGATVSLGSGASQVTKSESVTITCGTKSAVMKVEPTVVALTGISLSASSLLKGSTATVKILPTPANATLPACATFANGLSNVYATVSGDTISLTSNAATLDAKRSLTVQCGTFTAPLDIVLPFKVTEKTEADGSLTLQFKLEPDTADVSKPGKVWAAARIPAAAFFVTTDSWFFRTPDTWATLLLPNPDLLIFKTYSPLAATQDMSVPLGLPADILKYYSVEIHLGYQATSGNFKNLGKIWP